MKYRCRKEHPQFLFNLSCSIAIGAALCGISTPVQSQESSSSLTNTERLRRTATAGGLGGPQSVTAQIEEDQARKERRSRRPGVDEFFQPYEDWQARLNEDYGLFTRFDYQAVGQWANNSLTNDDGGAAGHIRLLGKWNLVGRGTDNPGNFVFLIQQKHQIGSGVTPANLAGNVGYLGQTAVSFGDVGGHVAVANWQQTLAGGNAGVVVGLLDPTDYTDILGYANQRTTFMNASSLINLTVAAPAPGFGIAAGGLITDQIYAVGVVSDANGSATEIDWFPGGSEFYSYGEVGWTPSRDQRYLTNVHLGLWNIDERKSAGVADDQGIVLSGNVTIDDVFMPFVRAGWAKEGVSGFKTAASGGFIYSLPKYGDLLGLTASWNEPADPTLRNQTTLEAFYRYNFSDNVALTLDGQLLFNPSLHPTEDVIGVLGFRFRFTM